MRILILIHQFCPEFSGGTERVALNLARSAQRAGHHVHVLACTIDPSSISTQPCRELVGALQFVHEGVPVTLLPFTSLPKAANISFEADQTLVKRLSAWMKLERFDVAHIMHPMRMGSALLAVQRCGLPYLVTLTDFFYACFRINLTDTLGRTCLGPQAGARCANNCLTAPWTPKSLASRHQQAQGLLAAAGARIAPSEYVAKCYRDAFPDLEFAVIPHGVDLLALTAKCVGRSLQEKERLTLGFIGSLVPQKGLDTLLRAFAQVPTTSLRLRVVGGFNLHGDPVYQRTLQLLADSDSRVELLGQVSPEQAFEVIHGLDVLCLPSRVPESFSLVLHEAAAAGVPALVSDLGNPGEQIAQKGGGRALPAEDIGAWTEAISELVAQPDLLKSWRAELSLPLRIEEEAFFYESLYRRLINSV